MWIYKLVHLMVYRTHCQSYSRECVMVETRNVFHKRSRTRISTCMFASNRMSDVMICEYLQSVSSFHQGKPSLMMLDLASSHLNTSVKNEFAKHNFQLAVIPGGHTSVLQPLDVGIIKPFKDRVRKYWSEWMSEKNNFAQKPGKPTYLDVCKWVACAWENLNAGTIVNSFNKALK